MERSAGKALLGFRGKLNCRKRTYAGGRGIAQPEAEHETFKLGNRRQQSYRTYCEERKVGIKERRELSLPGVIEATPVASALAAGEEG